MKNYKCLVTFLFVGLCACKTTKNAYQPYETATLTIIQLTVHSFVHVTYLQSETFGKVACNGLVFIKNGEAIVFDTPTNDTVSFELMDWVEKKMKSRIKAVVINHFHEDCLGGLKAFHKRHILSYANIKTLELAAKKEFEVPQQGFELKQELKIGGQKIINQFYGEGHTKDNIVSYIPSENVLFGGCMIKEVGAGFGNLADANTKEWSKTVQKIKENIPNLTFVIPGHGKVGGVELLDYTIEKFKNKE